MGVFLTAIYWATWFGKIVSGIYWLILLGCLAAIIRCRILGINPVGIELDLPPDDTPTPKH
jgi:hypothetical protein